MMAKSMAIERLRQGERSGMRIIRTPQGAHHSYSRFKLNEHGHVIAKFVGLPLFAADEMRRLGEAGIYVQPETKMCLLSEHGNSYDAKHRLIARREYSIALMPTGVIASDEGRTTEHLRHFGVVRYGYKKPLAGFAPRILEKVSLEHLREEMGYEYIAVPHDPIDCGGMHQWVLTAQRKALKRELGSAYGGPSDLWNSRGCFAFEVV